MALRRDFEYLPIDSAARIGEVCGLTVILRAVPMGVMALIVFIYGIGSSWAQGTSGQGCLRRCKLGSAALMVSRGLSARILARHGQHRDAEHQVCSSAALAAQTDLLAEHADTLLELSHVLAAAGQISEANSAATQALELYQRNGNLPGARESLRYLTQSALA